MEEHKVSSQRASQKRKAAISKEVRALHDRYYESLSVQRVPSGFWVEWSFTQEQLEVIAGVAESHGLDVDGFLRLIAQAAMTRAPRMLRPGVQDHAYGGVGE